MVLYVVSSSYSSGNDQMSVFIVHPPRQTIYSECSHCILTQSINQKRVEQVQELNHDNKVVKLIQADVNWTTKQRLVTQDLETHPELTYLFLEISRKVSFCPSVGRAHGLFRDVNALQTYRVREIKESLHHTYYGRELCLCFSVFATHLLNAGVEIFCQVFGSFLDSYIFFCAYASSGFYKMR